MIHGDQGTGKSGLMLYASLWVKAAMIEDFLASNEIRLLIIKYCLFLIILGYTKFNGSARIFKNSAVFYLVTKKRTKKCQGIPFPDRP